MGIAHPNTAAGAEEILELVRVLPPEKRRTISVELAPRADAPRELMRLLAQDEIIIAEPVILESPVLTEDDLCAIAKCGSPAHVARLRQRPNLPGRVIALLDPLQISEPILLAKLRAHSIAEFRSLFVNIAGDEAAAALDALQAGVGEPLAVACKTAGLSRAAYSSIVLLSDVGHMRPPEITEALLEAYESPKAA
jgi:uncharacterized protein (DUF2336 family)